jgi:hypothetical protein
MRGPAGGVAFDLAAHGAFGDGEGDADGDDPSGEIRDVGDHAQFDDVAAQFGIDDTFEALRRPVRCGCIISCRLQGKYGTP